MASDKINFASIAQAIKQRNEELRSRCYLLAVQFIIEQASEFNEPMTRANFADALYDYAVEWLNDKRRQ